MLPPRHYRSSPCHPLPFPPSLFPCPLMTTTTRPLLQQLSSLSSAPLSAPHHCLHGLKPTMMMRQPHPSFPSQDNDNVVTSPFAIDCHFHPPNCCLRSSTTTTSRTPTIPLNPPVDPSRHAERSAMVPNDNAAPLLLLVGLCPYRWRGRAVPVLRDIS